MHLPAPRQDFHTVVFHSGVAKRLLASRELFGERLLGGVLRPMQVCGLATCST